MFEVVFFFFNEDCVSFCVALMKLLIKLTSEEEHLDSEGVETYFSGWNSIKYNKIFCFLSSCFLVFFCLFMYEGAHHSIFPPVEPILWNGSLDTKEDTFLMAVIVMVFRILVYFRFWSFPPLLSVPLSLSALIGSTCILLNLLCVFPFVNSVISFYSNALNYILSEFGTRLCFLVFLAQTIM